MQFLISDIEMLGKLMDTARMPRLCPRLGKVSLLIQGAADLKHILNKLCSNKTL